MKGSVLIVAALMTASVFAEGAPTAAVQRRDPRDLMELKKSKGGETNSAQRPVKKKGIPSGGFIELANTGKVVQVWNDQKVCPLGAVTGTANMIKLRFGYPAVVKEGRPTGGLEPNVAARISVIADDTSPMLLVAPDEGWAQINVKPLAADGPDEVTLRKRTIKQLWRAFGQTLGCCYSMVLPCVMAEARTPQALDELVVEFGPEAQGKIVATAQRRGLLMTKRVRYRQACKEGWAPAPTNDIQKAIWDEYKVKPSEPIKIEFDPKKGE